MAASFVGTHHNVFKQVHRPLKNTGVRAIALDSSQLSPENQRGDKGVIAGPIYQHQSRNLALELVRVTEAAALAAGRWLGKGDKNAADQAAVDMMRKVLNTVDMDGIVVIGEGEKDEAPMLYWYATPNHLSESEYSSTLAHSEPNKWLKNH